MSLLVREDIAFTKPLKPHTAHEATTSYWCPSSKLLVVHVDGGPWFRTRTPSFCQVFRNRPPDYIGSSARHPLARHG